MIGIYKIENNINHKKYIGQSVDIRKRWEYHRCVYTYKTNSRLYAAFRKYGIENFSFEVLEECPIEKLLEREMYWIEYYNTFEQGYNCNIGGCSGKPRKVLQYDLNGNYLNTYESLTIAASTLNLSSSNLSSCCTGKQKSYGGYLWTYEDEESPKQYIDNKYGHTTSTNKRIVQQYSKDNIFIQEYNSAHEAARQIGKPKCANHITECCQNKRKTCEGFIWKYKEE